MNNPTVALMLVVVAGVGAQWLANRLRLPSILLLLLFGLTIGPLSGWVTGTQWLSPDQLLGRDFLFSIVSLFVAVVLFDGGLSLRFSELKRVGRAVIQLTTIAVVVAWTGCALACYWILGLHPALSLMMGALLVVTGPTVIIPILRQVRPSANVASVLKWEGIVNDPIGAILAVLTLEAIVTGDLFDPSWHLVTDLLATFGVGMLFGAAGALAMVICLRRYWIPDALEVSVILMVVVMTFVTSNLIKEESGLLAVTLMGILMANQKWAEVRHIIAFKEHLASLLVAVLFILLAARVTQQDLMRLNWNAAWFVAALILIVRPITVFLSTLGTSLKWQERLFVAWMAPRGVVAAAVASLFVLRLDHASAQVPAEVTAQVDQLVPIMFLVILGTIAVYGLSAFPLSRGLKLATANPQGVLLVSANPLARALGKTLLERHIDVLLVDTNLSAVRKARMEGLKAWHGDVLSERRMDTLETPGIGRTVILTPNDQVNALIAIHMTDEFGRREVYRIHPVARSASDGGNVEETISRGRLLFDESRTLDKLLGKLRDGWVIKAIKLSEKFDFKAMTDHYHGHAIVLGVIRKDGRLIFDTADAPIELEANQTVIALVEKSANGEQASEKSA